MFEPNVITVTATACLKGCTRQAVYNAIGRGDLNTVQMGSFTLIAKDEKYQAYKIKETGGRSHKRYSEKKGNRSLGEEV